MFKKLSILITLLMVATIILTACAPKTPEPTKAPEATAVPGAIITKTYFTMWTKEGEADGGFQYVKAITDAYTAAHPEVVFDVINKDVETLREDFQTTSLAGNPPDLLWTVSDHAGPFTAAELIMPVDDLVDLTLFVDSAVNATKLNGQTWGVPIANGNHLMLLYNKDLVPVAPKNTDEMISMAKAITTGDVYGLVYNQTEPFFIVPWLYGFGGKVFANDGVTPTLDTPEMIATLKFLHDIKYTDKIVPAESDYNGADTLFKEGKAGMIINGDWSLGGYQEALGDKLGVAPIPIVKATGLYPAPMTSGVFFMIPAGQADDRLAVIKDFITFATSEENQLKMVADLKRLPALKSALGNELITGDPLLAGSAEQMTHGVPMPIVLEMRCVWDGWKPEMQAVLTDTKTPEDAAAAAQAAAVTCISQLE
jgi:arabinogalactan oligomer / maltooligosaccharide transport system substrate-binding protein